MAAPFIRQNRRERTSSESSNTMLPRQTSHRRLSESVLRQPLPQPRYSLLNPAMMSPFRAYFVSSVTTSIINGIHQRRLFMSQNGCLCEFAPRSRTKGYPIGSQTVEHWTALNPAEPKRTNIVRKFQHYAAKAEAYFVSSVTTSIHRVPS